MLSLPIKSDSSEMSLASTSVNKSSNVKSWMPPPPKVNIHSVAIDVIILYYDNAPKRHGVVAVHSAFLPSPDKKYQREWALWSSLYGFVILVRENVAATLYATRLTEVTESEVAVRAGCIWRRHSAILALIPAHFVLIDIDGPVVQSPNSTYAWAEIVAK